MQSQMHIQINIASRKRQFTNQLVNVIWCPNFPYCFQQSLLLCLLSGSLFPAILCPLHWCHVSLSLLPCVMFPDVLYPLHSCNRPFPFGHMSCSLLSFDIFTAVICLVPGCQVSSSLLSCILLPAVIYPVSWCHVTCSLLPCIMFPAVMWHVPYFHVPCSQLS